MQSYVNQLFAGLTTPLKSITFKIGHLLLVIAAISLMMPAALQAATQVSQFGITWTFDKDYQVGQFANGDYWVIGPVTIVGFSPASTTTTAGRTINGSMINPAPTLDKQGYDSDVYPWAGAFYDPSLNKALGVSTAKPLIVPSNSSLVSTISVSASGQNQVIQTAAVLTVLPSAPAAGSFRPPYAGTDKTIKYNKTQLNYTLLKNLAPVASTPAIATVEGYFQKPWIDHMSGWSGNAIHPLDNMPAYGNKMADQVSAGALMLHLNFTNAQKETLLVRYVQLGIDLYGIIQAGGTDHWYADGGHASGRKWPILFTGLLLNDTNMKTIGQKSGDYLTSGTYGVGNVPPDYIHFGEDDQTYYVAAENIGAIVEEQYKGTHVYGDDLDTTTVVEQYLPADAGLPEWGIRHEESLGNDKRNWDANYRRCCNANGWAGFILAAHIMNVKSLWNHNALFDFQDRYMAVEKTLGTAGTYERQWTAFTENMWDTYRASYGSVWTRTNPNDIWSNGSNSGSTTPADTVAPLAPTALTSSAQTSSSINLSWTASAAASDGDLATSYRIIRNGTQVGQVATSSFQDTGLTAGTSYSYQVYSVDDAGNQSTTAATGSFSTKTDTVAPLAPTALTSSAQTTTSINLSWTASAAASDGDLASSYRILRNGTQVGQVATTSFQDTGLTTGTSYSYQVYSVDKTGNQSTSAATGSFSTATTPPPATGPVGYWNFDESSGTTAADASGNSNTATLVNGAVPGAAGKLGNSVQLSSTNEAVQVSMAKCSATAGTISMWVYADSFTAPPHYLFAHAIVPWSNRIQLYINDTSGNLAIGLGDTHFLTTNIQTLAAQTWYHIALTWDGTNYVVYVNGAAKATGAYTGLTALNTMADIGNDGSATSRVSGFDGRVDETKLYNRALSATEVQALATVAPPTTYTLAVTATNGSVAKNPSAASYTAGTVVTLTATPASGYSFANWSGDLTGSTNPATITMNANKNVTANFAIINVNHAPVLNTIGNKTAGEGTSCTFTVSASDVDGNPITYSSSTLPAGAALNSSTGVFSWTPNYTQAGAYPITFTASDGSLTASQSMTITVNNVDRAPVLSPIGNKSVLMGAPLTFAVSATDPDGDLLTYTAANLPAGATFANRTFSWAPAAVGTYPATFTVSDGVLTASETIAITVSARNDANLIDSLVLDMAFNDPPADGVTDCSPYANNGTCPTNGIPTLVSGKFYGGYSFDGISDSVIIQDSQFFDVNQITIAAWIDPNGYVVNQRILSRESGAVPPCWVYSLLLNGANQKKLEFWIGLNDGIDYNFTSNADIPLNTWTHVAATYDGNNVVLYINGQIDYAESGVVGTLRHTDAPIYIGASQYSHAFFKGALDEVLIYNSALNQAEIQELLLPANAPPVLAAIGNKTVSEGQKLSFTLNATDPDGDVITYSAKNLPAGATFSGNTFSWTPDYTQAGNYPVTFSASDGELQDTQTITITADKAANPNGAFIDNFDGSSLNTSRWTFINPLGDASLSLSGGLLKIAVPAGKTHDIGTTTNYAPRIMTPVANTDFQIEARFNSEVSLTYQMQGLLVEQDSKNFIRFEIYSSGSYTLWYLRSVVNGSTSISKWKTITRKAPYYVRTGRVGNVFTFYYSYDGITWTTATSCTRTMVPASAGVYFANHGTTSSNAPALNGSVDYFMKK